MYSTLKTCLKKTKLHRENTQPHTSKMSCSTKKVMDHAWLLCCFFGFWVLGGGWAGFLGALGGVRIAPALIPAPHLPSSRRPFRSCRSNQSSSDCLTSEAVIQPTPMFHSKLFLALSLPFCLLQYCSRRPLSVLWFLMPGLTPAVGFLTSI